MNSEVKTAPAVLKNPTECWSDGVLGFPITPPLHHSNPTFHGIRNQQSAIAQARPVTPSSLLKYSIERRVGARGLHYFLGKHGSCRPGALTGPVFQQAASQAQSNRVKPGQTESNFSLQPFAFSLSSQNRSKCFSTSIFGAKLPPASQYIVGSPAQCATNGGRPLRRTKRRAANSQLANRPESNPVKPSQTVLQSWP